MNCYVSPVADLRNPEEYFLGAVNGEINNHNFGAFFFRNWFQLGPRPDPDNMGYQVYLNPNVQQRFNLPQGQAIYFVGTRSWLLRCLLDYQRATITTQEMSITVRAKYLDYKKLYKLHNLPLPLKKYKHSRKHLIVGCAYNSAGNGLDLPGMEWTQMQNELPINTLAGVVQNLVMRTKVQNLNNVMDDLGVG
jgi:hypothetical protein